MIEMKTLLWFQHDIESVSSLISSLIHSWVRDFFINKFLTWKVNNMCAWVIIPSVMITGVIISALGPHIRNSKKSKARTGSGSTGRFQTENKPIMSYARRRSNLDQTFKSERIGTYSTISNLSGKLSKTNDIKSISTEVIARLSDDDPLEVVYDAVVIHLQVYSTQMFSFIPCLVLTENGETITNTECDSTDVQTALADSISAGDWLYDIGPMIHGKNVQSSTHWRGEINLDITDFVNAYAFKASKNEIEEQAQPNLDLVGITITQDNATQVNINGSIDYSFHYKRQDHF